MNQQPQGFTLIELIMVIVILAILSAFAVPKFSDFDSQAKRAAQDGIIASLESSARIAYAACLADASCNHRAASSTVVVDGSTITLAFGYPAATNTGITQMVDLDTSISSIHTTGPNITTLTLSSGCDITYSEPVSTLTPPSFGGSCN